MTELKLCPFCGGEAEISEAHLSPTMKGPGALISVTVRHWCGPALGVVASHVEFRGRDHASAIAAWNRRANPSDEIVGLVMRLTGGSANPAVVRAQLAKMKGDSDEADQLAARVERP